MSTQNLEVVVFTLNQQLFAIPCSFIRRIINAVEISDIPNAPTDILGVINYHDEIIPVIDIRNKMGINPKNININDFIVIVDLKQHTFCFIVETIHFQEVNLNNIEPVSSLINGIEGVSKIIKDETGIINILDADFLFNEEILNIIPEHKKAQLE